MEWMLAGWMERLIVLSGVCSMRNARSYHRDPLSDNSPRCRSVTFLEFRPRFGARAHPVTGDPVRGRGRGRRLAKTHERPGTSLRMTATMREMTTRNVPNPQGDVKRKIKPPILLFLPRPAARGRTGRGKRISHSIRRVAWSQFRAGLQIHLHSHSFALLWSSRARPSVRSRSSVG